MIKQAAHYLHNAQSESYIVNVPIAVLVQRAGGKYEFMQLHDPEWNVKLMFAEENELLESWAPWLITQEYNVAIELQGAERADERCERGLYTAEGALKALRLYLLSVLKGAAARPLDANNYLLKDEQPIYKQFGHPVFSSPVFYSEQFT